MRIKGFTPLLQNDYGELKDCALTSITACTLYLTDTKNDQMVYLLTEKVAHLWGYSGTKWGTWSSTIKPIWEAVLDQCNKPSKVAARYFKGLGYSLQTIQEQISKGNPVILSVSKISNTLYKNHTITIVGYEGEKLFVYDNWSRILRQIYYKDISFNSSVNFVR